MKIWYEHQRANNPFIEHVDFPEPKYLVKPQPDQLLLESQVSKSCIGQVKWELLSCASAYSHSICKSKTEVTDAKGCESIDIHDAGNR
jgi:hypothetical protein